MKFDVFLLIIFSSLSSRNYQKCKDKRQETPNICSTLEKTPPTGENTQEIIIIINLKGEFQDETTKSSRLAISQQFFKSPSKSEIPPPSIVIF